MTTIVKRLRACDLPPVLRDGLEPDAEVEVSVTEIGRGERRVAAATQVLRALQAYRSRTGARPLSKDEVRARVREARGE